MPRLNTPKGVQSEEAWISNEVTFFNFQINLSPGLKKLFTVTAVSAISVIFLAHHFKRKRGRKNKQVSQWEPGHLLLECTKAAASEKGTQRNPKSLFVLGGGKGYGGVSVCNSI